MKIHSIIEGTSVNGPGYRLGIWVQGCKRNCLGCFNLDACKMEGGTEISVEELLKYAQKKCYDGITVSGGEPFYQSKELFLLLKRCKKIGLNTLIYTGYTWEELYNSKNKALKYCDYLIDGPYIKDIPSSCEWAGSGNQRFLQLKKGRIVADLTNFQNNCTNGEVFINSNGNITVTGFLDIK